MKHHKKCLTALFIGLACLMNAAEPAEKTDAEMEYELNATLTESELLKSGSVAPEDVVLTLFKPDAQKKWARVMEDFSEKKLDVSGTKFPAAEHLRDFFCGAMILRGPVSEKYSIAGIYNAWWDAMLITQCMAETVTLADGASDEIWKVSDFEFVSGAVFRGENGTETDVAKKLASPDGSPSKVVLDLTSRTKKKFEAMYGGQKVPILLDHSNNRDLSKKQIVACAGVRLKMAQILLNDKARYNDAWSIAKVLRNGNRDTFGLLFPSEFGTMMSGTFCRLPKSIRANFEPYGYYPDKKGGKARVYVFINTEYPRLFAVTSLGLGDESTIEWYDFYQCDELTKAFEMAEKEAGK